MRVAILIPVVGLLACSLALTVVLLRPEQVALKLEAQPPPIREGLLEAAAKSAPAATRLVPAQEARAPRT
jgi:hypothetical protein